MSHSRSIGSIALLAAALACTSCGESSTETEHTDSIDIRIHGGSTPGNYKDLIDKLGEVLQACESGDPSCASEIQIGLTHLNCDDSGSRENLRHLGMQEVSPGAAKQLTPCDADAAVRVEDGVNGENAECDLNIFTNTLPWVNRECFRDKSRHLPNTFALVQDAFIYSSTATCERNILTSLYFWANDEHEEFRESCRLRLREVLVNEYEPFDELRVVLPMFYSRIQIVTVGSPEMEMRLKDLEGKKIYLGDGVNWLYGREVLERHPIVVRELAGKTVGLEIAQAELARKTQIPVHELPTGQKKLGNMLLACGIVDAYIISGEVVSQETITVQDFKDDRFSALGCHHEIPLKQVRIPEPIIRGMAVGHPYYRELPAPEVLERTGFEYAMPAVTTYLVTTKDAAEPLVRRLTRAMHAEWLNLMLLKDDVVPLEENIYKRPARLHVGARNALQEVNLLGKDMHWAFIGLGLIAFAAIIFKSEISYDRLGDRREKSYSRDVIRVLAIIFGTAMIFSLVVMLMRALEASQAAGLGVDNPIASRDFGPVLLWMFTFISSGYENNVFPNSPVSIVIISLFAIIGIALPIWLIVKVVERMRERRLEQARGGEPRRREKIKDGLLLLCGWNSKAPGLIYSLTCRDSPYSGKISIVADMDVEFPIEHWHFDKRRVRFYRGDAFHRSVLEKARLDAADAALILADDDTGSGSNGTGVLTATAINSLAAAQERRISIAAEMTRDSERSFTAKQSGVDAVINPQDISERMVALACFNPLLLSFVLDALSPDDFCEWYEIPSGEISKRFMRSKDTFTVADYARVLYRHGISIVGVCQKGEAADNGNRAAELHLLTSAGDGARRLPAFSSSLICAAQDPDSLFPRSRRSLKQRASSEIDFRSDPEDRSIVTPIAAATNVLIVGYQDHALSLTEYMSKSFPSIIVEMIATDSKDVDDINDEIKARVSAQDWSHIILLSSLPDYCSAAEYARHSIQADSETILRASLIQIEKPDSRKSPILIAEVNRTDSRQLARDNGVKTTVPSRLLAERMMARLIDARGHVYDLMVAMLSADDGVYLRSVKLDEDHPLVGSRFGDVLYTWFRDGRVLGLLPKDSLEDYRNMSGDFQYHFVMCPTKEERDIELQADDTVIVLGFPDATASVSEADNNG